MYSVFRLIYLSGYIVSHVCVADCKNLFLNADSYTTRLIYLYIMVSTIQYRRDISEAMLTRRTVCVLRKYLRRDFKIQRIIKAVYKAFKFYLKVVTVIRISKVSLKQRQCWKSVYDGKKIFKYFIFCTILFNNFVQKYENIYNSILMNWKNFFLPQKLIN